MAESFSEAKSTLEEVLRFYKWGRHAKGFPEEVYLLLSRCTYVCFSLWRSDQESGGGFFHRSPPPAIFWSGVDLGELRGQEPEAGVLPADSREAPLTNDAKWFEFWMRILARSDPRGASLYPEFSRQILACVGHRQWLDIPTSLQSRKALRLFLQTDQAGHVLQRTIAVLEDTIQAILRYFTTLDGRTCVLEKITLLAGVLGEMRQIVVWETPARGPYAPSGDTHWRVRSPWTWLSCDRSQGVLTVIPKREGGEILCTYCLASDAKGRFSWARQVASLKGTYEEELFATWSYDTGEHRENPSRFPGVTACWTVQYAEAQRLETLSRQVDLLLAALQGNPRCQRLVGAVRGILRNGAPRWKATMLPWTYVKQLDQLLHQLTLVYRQANALGGDDATEHVVAQIWPAGETTIRGAGPSHPRSCPGGPVTREVAAQSGTLAAGAGKSMASESGPSTLDRPQPSAESSEPFPAGPSVQESSLVVPRGPAEAEERVGERPPCAEAALSAGPTEADPEGTVVPASQAEPATKPSPERRTTNRSDPEEMAKALLQRLLAHHRCLEGTMNYEPISAAELQRELGWDPSKLQRALTRVFGPKPMRSYRSKCQDGSIATFLQACAVGVRRPARTVLSPDPE